MQRRLLVIALVFVAGFGVGYGITWLLVGSSGRGGDAPDERPAARPALVAGADAGADAAVALDTATAPAPDGVAAAADTGPVPSSADVAVAAPDSASAAAVEVAAAAEVAAAEPAPKAAWEACHKHVCRVDFGDITGGISIRAGSLEHGQALDWDRQFAKADKIGTLDSDKKVKVEVLAIALDNGEPAAAYIARKTRRGEVKGVIALRIGDKQLRLVPLEP